MLNVKIVQIISVLHFIQKCYSDCQPSSMIQWGSNCYQYAGSKMTWFDAKMYCETNFKAHLPTIKNANDWTYFNNFRSSISDPNYQNNDDVWLSANAYFDVGGNYRWHDRTLVNQTFSNWFVSTSNHSVSYPEPSPVGCRFCCPWNYCDAPGACSVSLGSYDVYNGAWATASCDSAMFHAICMKPIAGACSTLGVNYGTITYSDPTCVNATTCSNGTSATISCSTGTPTITSITCQNGTWTPFLPSCNVGCAGITDVNSANISFYPPFNTSGAVPELVKVSISCNQSASPYFQVGRSYCFDGSWYPLTPVCVPTCPSLAFIPHGNINYSDQAIAMNSQATLTCDSGYAVNGTGGNPQTSQTIFCATNSTWIDVFKPCQDLCDFEPCLNNGTCTSTPNFFCTCKVPFSGTHCEIYTQPCNSTGLPPAQVGRKRKKRQLKFFTDIINTAGGLVKDVVVIVQNLGNVLNGVVHLNVSQVLSSVVNPLAATLNTLVNGTLTLVNDVVVNAVVKGLLEPVLTPLVQIVPKIIPATGCVLTQYVDCAYSDCNSQGYQVRIDPIQSNLSCMTNLPMNKTCTAHTIKPKATTTEYIQAPDPLTPSLRLTVTVVEGSSCVVLIGLLAFTLGAFLLLRIFSIERIPQMCQEISLLIAHILILTLKKATNRRTVCIVTSVFMQFFTLANFTFMILEALQVYVVLQNVVSIGGFYNRKQILLIGWGVPAIITGLLAGFRYNEYPSTYSCWLNLTPGNGAQGGTIYPIVFATGMIMIMAEAATLIRLKPLPFDSQAKRNSALVSQSSLFIILILNIMSWVAGMYAAFDPSFIWLYPTLAILNILLGVAICLFHITGNDEVHGYCKKIWNKICCCCNSSKEADKYA